jgi:HD-like signal output (HDOD) protein
MTTTQEHYLLALARIERFSPAPRVLARAMSLLRDPDSDLGSIAELIGSDPALAAEVIRCANGAYYGARLPARTIGEAVGKIGVRETIRVINLYISRAMVGRNLRSYGLSADGFQTESLFHGLFLFHLAGKTDRADPDEAYTVGLLRFIGRLAVDQLMQDNGQKLPRGKPVSEWELEGVGFLQAQAGAILLSKWQFPEEMVEAVSEQDSPDRLDAPNWLAEALQFAWRVIPQEQLKPASPAALLAPFMEANGLSQKTVEEMLAATQQSFIRAREAF